MEKSESLIKHDGALVPSNPAIQSLAKRFRWRPEITIVRIQRALPSPLEQQIYLALAEDFSLLPESMAKFLRFYLAQEELRLDDLVPRVVGPNMVTSRFSTFSEFLRECLNLMKIVSKDASFSLTIEQVAMIVQHYGVNEPERLIEMIDSNLDEMCLALGVSRGHSYSQRMRLCIWLMVSKIIPENRAHGRPDVLDISDLENISSARRREMQRAIADDFGDEDVMQDRSMEILKREGII